MTIALDTETTIVTAQNSGRYINQQHIMRYVFARSLLQPGSVAVDVGCGIGYGAEYVARRASATIACDYSPSAVNLAQRWHEAPNVCFACADAKDLPVATASADLVVSFEVIEHVPDVNRYLAEIHRVLRPGGVFVCSTPCRSRFKAIADYHEREYLPVEMSAALKPYFASVEMYGQFVPLGTVLGQAYLDAKVFLAHQGRLTLERFPGGAQLVARLRDKVRVTENNVDLATTQAYRIGEEDPGFERHAVRELARGQGTLRNLVAVAVR